MPRLTRGYIDCPKARSSNGNILDKSQYTKKWLFLLPKRWNKHVQYAWRYAPRELEPEGDAAPLESAPRVELAASDDEYLTEDECMSDA